ncbi:MAG: hypothetical protein M5U26_25385 [Planctomycetota bacterium]|nr:hypothetical protein [Planctomycetota bacterium]
MYVKGLAGILALGMLTSGAGWAADDQEMDIAKPVSAPVAERRPDGGDHRDGERKEGEVKEGERKWPEGEKREMEQKGLAFQASGTVEGKFERGILFKVLAIENVWAGDKEAIAKKLTGQVIKVVGNSRNPNAQNYVKLPFPASHPDSLALRHAEGEVFMLMELNETQRGLLQKAGLLKDERRDGDRKEWDRKEGDRKEGEKKEGERHEGGDRR